MMNSMMRLQLRKMQRLFTVLRWAEAVAVLLFAVRGAPSLARASGDFLRASASVILGPRFLFLLGNAIVILLFFNKNNTTDDGTTTTTTMISSFIPPPVLLETPAREEVVFEDKEVVVSKESSSTAVRANNYRRSRSEKIDVRRAKGSPEPELRRSKTGPAAVDPAKEDQRDGDAEEFRRTIEAFIEKQLKFQRQESMSTSTNLLAIVSVQQQEEEEDDDDGVAPVKEKD